MFTFICSAIAITLFSVIVFINRNGGAKDEAKPFEKTYNPIDHM